MKLEAMNFATPSNACLSLRILAEKVRAGDATLVRASTLEGPAGHVLTIQISTPTPAGK
jgi:hypothetical protein